ncbi:MAG: hypothetical protein ACRCU2_19945 [Planktothrix sp.]
MGETGIKRVKRSHLPINVGADSYPPKPNFQAIASPPLFSTNSQTPGQPRFPLAQFRPTTSAANPLGVETIPPSYLPGWIPRPEESGRLEA